MMFKISYRAEFEDIYGHTVKSRGSFYTEYAPYDDDRFPLEVVSHCCPNILGYEKSSCLIRVYEAGESKKKLRTLNFVNTMDIMRRYASYCLFWYELKDPSPIDLELFEKDIEVTRKKFLELLNRS